MKYHIMAIDESGKRKWLAKAYADQHYFLTWNRLSRWTVNSKRAADSKRLIALELAPQCDIYIIVE